MYFWKLLKRVASSNLEIAEQCPYFIVTVAEVGD
jgi:hypothetical protein